MNITKRPPAIFAAFNPAILELEDDTSDFISVGIFTLHPGEPVIKTIERDVINSKASFNISNVIKKDFLDFELVKENYIIDLNLVVRHIINPGLIVVDALNAVAQIGESSDFTNKRGTFRTNLKKLIIWQGYERRLSYLSYPSISYLVYDDDPAIPIQLTEVIPHITIVLPENKKLLSLQSEYGYEKLQNNAGEDITDNNGEIIEVASLNANKPDSSSILLETRCVPDNPFYIRWINQQAGWDYWMFSFRQTIERKIASQQTYNPTVFDQENAKSFTEEYYKEGKEKITVGASGMNDNEYECISKLIYSPKIQYYNKELGKWFGLIVDDGTNEKDTRASSKSVEFTFLLPTPQIQI